MSKPMPKSISSSLVIVSTLALAALVGCGASPHATSTSAALAEPAAPTPASTGGIVATMLQQALIDAGAPAIPPRAANDVETRAASAIACEYSTALADWGRSVPTCKITTAAGTKVLSDSPASELMAILDLSGLASIKAPADRPWLDASYDVSAIVCSAYATTHCRFVGIQGATPRAPQDGKQLMGSAESSWLVSVLDRFGARGGVESIQCQMTDVLSDYSRGPSYVCTATKGAQTLEPKGTPDELQKAFELGYVVLQHTGGLVATNVGTLGATTVTAKAVTCSQSNGLTCSFASPRLY